MIYATQSRAIEVAKMLNAIPGYAPAYVMLCKEGWIVVRAYVRPACECNICLEKRGHVGGNGPDSCPFSPVGSGGRIRF